MYIYARVYVSHKARSAVLAMIYSSCKHIYEDIYNACYRSIRQDLSDTRGVGTHHTFSLFILYLFYFFVSKRSNDTPASCIL